MKLALAIMLLVSGLVYACQYADINLDKKVDAKDVATAAKAFGTKEGDVRWNADCDINHDKVIDMKDLSAVAKCFGFNY